jgi:hypothetical protein
MVTLFASTEGELDAAIAGFVQMQAAALLIEPDALFLQRREQLAIAPPTARDLRDPRSFAEFSPFHTALGPYLPRTCATARPQLAKADTTFQAHPLINRLNLA